MRHVFVIASLCVLTCSSSFAADQKVFSDRLDGSEAAAGNVPTSGISTVAKTQEAAALPLDPQPMDQKAAELTTSMPQFAVLADKPIAIPQQDGTGDFLKPRALPAPSDKPKQVVNRSRDEVCDTLAQAAQNNNLPTPFFIRLLFQESGFKPGIVSHAGAQGIAQFMPETAASVGLDNPFDPIQAIPAAARLLRNLVDKFGNVGLAAAAYNAGPKRIHDWLERKGKLPHETQGYVKVITGRPAESWKGTSDRVIATRLPAEAPCKETVTVMAGNELPVQEAAFNPAPAHDSHQRVSMTKVAMAKREAAPGRTGHKAVAVPKNEPTPARGSHKAIVVAKNEPAPARAPAHKEAAATKAVTKKEPVKPTATLAARKQTHQRSRIASR
jgi:soluble lytic murein transglycosylase-like protein